jgi:6-pyruvoyltetrahydropterin/6-carboxytetrahydropterin synthase
MFQLSREVRFTVNAADVTDGGPSHPAEKPFNSFAGFPSMRGLGSYVSVQVTLAGALDRCSQYLLNIRDIDALVRQKAIPLVTAAYREQNRWPAALAVDLFERLALSGGPSLQSVRLNLSPFLSYSAHVSELPMVRLTQRFEFSASHRLHNPELPDSENREIFGKCNNPNGHGHNYELAVTLVGVPDSSGLLIDIPAFEKIVAETVIDRFDHRHLNLELPEFADLIPTVENIAMVIHRLLKPRLESRHARLTGVTVWETPKTWCEYSE